MDFSSTLVDDFPSKRLILSLVNTTPATLTESSEEIFWTDSDNWQFPTESQVTCPECHRYGNWADWYQPDGEETLHVHICVTGCITCVGENSWTWGKYKCETGELMDIDCNGCIEPQDFPDGLGTEANNIEVMNVKVNDLLDQYTDPIEDPLGLRLSLADLRWEQLYETIPKRCIDLITFILLQHSIDIQMINKDHIISLEHVSLIHEYYREWSELTDDTDEENTKRVESKQLCHDAIELIEGFSQLIPEGQYLELVNIIGEVHKRQ